jgi:dienelactone hydrolase
VPYDNHRVRSVALARPAGVRWLPGHPSGVGALVLAGSSGRVDEPRARLLAQQGALTESIQWFGGPGQPAGPWEVPLETFHERVAALAAECDRVLLLGTSFGAEAALLTGATVAGVDAVVAFAPSDVVWAGVMPDGVQTSHWTLNGKPVPFVPFDDDWTPDTDPPSFRDLYLRSRRADPAAVAAATIATERIPHVVLVAGGDDRVWPSRLHAEQITARRRAHGLPTVTVTDDHAGHRAILPGEPPVRAGARMQRGGSDQADRRLGESAWHAVARLLSELSHT